MARPEILIQGQKIPLKSSTKSENEVIQLAQTLISNAEKRMKNAAPHQIMLIALLELADDYQKAKEATVEWKQKIYQTATNLSSSLGA